MDKLEFSPTQLHELEGYYLNVLNTSDSFDEAMARFRDAYLPEEIRLIFAFWLGSRQTELIYERDLHRIDEKIKQMIEEHQEQHDYAVRVITESQQVARDALALLGKVPGVSSEAK